jgi:hypothetical protein
MGRAVLYSCESAAVLERETPPHIDVRDETLLTKPYSYLTSTEASLDAAHFVECGAWE